MKNLYVFGLLAILALPAAKAQIMQSSGAGGGSGDDQSAFCAVVRQVGPNQAEWCTAPQNVVGYADDWGPDIMESTIMIPQANDDVTKPKLSYMPETGWKVAVITRGNGFDPGAGGQGGDQNGLLDAYMMNNNSQFFPLSYGAQGYGDQDTLSVDLSNYADFAVLESYATNFEGSEQAPDATASPFNLVYWLSMNSLGNTGSPDFPLFLNPFSPLFLTSLYKFPNWSGNGEFLSFFSEGDLPPGSASPPGFYTWEAASNQIRFVTQNWLGESAISDSGDQIIFFGYYSQPNAGCSPTCGLGQTYLAQFQPAPLTLDIQIISKNPITGEPAHHGGSQSLPVTAAPDISEDGQWIAFASNAINLLPEATTPEWRVYLYSVANSSLSMIARGGNPKVANGGVVVFDSHQQLTGTDGPNQDVFLYEPSGGITLVSRNHNGGATNGHSSHPDLVVKEDGDLIIAFQSDATDIVSDDTNGFTDSFVVEMSRVEPSLLTQRVRAASPPRRVGGGGVNVIVRGP